MTKKLLIGFSRIADKIGNIKPIFAILLFIAFMVGRDVYNQVFKPITINPAGISKRAFNKQIKQENENIEKTLIQIEVLTYKLDSCKYVLDSVLYRKRSNLDTLQRWFNNY